MRMLRNTHLMEDCLSSVKIDLPTSRIMKQYYSVAETKMSLVGKIGGLLGLWTGISFIVGLEFLHLMFKLIRHGIKTRCSSRKRTVEISAYELKTV